MSPAPIPVTGALILGPSLKPSQTAKFQCLTTANGRPLGWRQALAPVSLGGAWIPSISEAPNHAEGCSLWRIIEASAPRKYYLTPYLCTKYLKMAEKAGTRFPLPVETMLIMQGGDMLTSTVSTTGK
jgi:hypothetical protein